MQDAAPDRLQPGFALELPPPHMTVGIRGGAQRVLLQPVGVDPPRRADLPRRGLQRSGNLGLEDPPLVADRTAGRASAVVGPPPLEQQVQVGDFWTDLLGDLFAGRLLGAAMLLKWPETGAISTGGVARSNTSRPLARPWCCAGR